MELLSSQGGRSEKAQYWILTTYAKSCDREIDFYGSGSEYFLSTFTLFRNLSDRYGQLV